MSGMGPGIMSAVKEASSKKQKENAVLESIKRTKSKPLPSEGPQVITGYEPGIDSTRGGRKRKTKRRKRKSRKKRRRKKTKKRRRKKRTKRR